jgi:hypothetical protein
MSPKILHRGHYPGKRRPKKTDRHRFDENLDISPREDRAYGLVVVVLLTCIGVVLTATMVAKDIIAHY